MEGVVEQEAPKHGRRGAAASVDVDSPGDAPRAGAAPAAGSWLPDDAPRGGATRPPPGEESTTDSVAVATGGDDAPTARGGSRAAAAAASAGKHSWGGPGGGDEGGGAVVIREADDAVESAEALAATVADAPRNTGGRRVATLSELDGDASASASGLNVSASRASGIDLSLLTASLYPPASLDEPRDVIDWALALQRITQEMTAEKEKREAGAAADGIVAPAAGAGGAGGGAGAEGSIASSTAGRTRGGETAGVTRK